MMLRLRLIRLLLLQAVLVGRVSSWCPTNASPRTWAWTRPTKTQPSSSVSFPLTVREASSGDTDNDTAQQITVELVVKDNYPDFHKLLLSQNENIFNLLENDIGINGYTIFAPNEQAFAALSDKQRLQIKDPRNAETTQKMGLYHIVADAALSMTDLNREDWTVPKTSEGLPALKFGALITMAGEVPIGRYKQTTKGSIFRSIINKKKTVRDKDGQPLTEIVVGPSGRILRSVKVGKAVIHECDGFVSPNLLWRYFDQLRLPGL